MLILTTQNKPTRFSHDTVLLMIGGMARLDEPFLSNDRQRDYALSNPKEQEGQVKGVTLTIHPRQCS